MSILNRVLVILTNHYSYPTKTHKTGAWLSEITHFCNVMERKGFSCDFASPKGGHVPIDEKSLKLKDTTNKAYYEDVTFRHRLENTTPLHEIKASDYQIVYLAGGHGTMWDFRQNVDLQKIVREIYENNGLIAAVCHGVAGLLNITLSDGSLLIKNKRITGFNNLEERLVGLHEEVPFLLEDELRKSGADYEKSFIPFMPFIIVSERLITGQNPFSTRKVARKVLEELSDK